jgi:hypothetical protein
MPTAKHHCWTPEELALLGTDTDEAVARRLGRTRSAVTSRRVNMGIGAFSGWSAGGRDWTAGELGLLGGDFDEVIAGRIGRTRPAVSQMRLELGIPAFRDRRRR